MTCAVHYTSGSQSIDSSHMGGIEGGLRGGSLSRASMGGNRGSLASMGKPTSSTLASLAGLFKERDDRINEAQKEDTKEEKQQQQQQQLQQLPQQQGDSKVETLQRVRVSITLV